MTRLIAFFPWLFLKEPVTVGEVVIVPFRDESGKVSEAIVDLQPSLEKLLSSYTDIKGNPVKNCTVATISARNPIWDLVFEEDREKVQLASQLLSLASISRNDFNAQLGCYANSTKFQFFLQSFTEPVDFIAIGVRRRDGSTMDGGYKHGEIKFSVPLQARSLEPVCIDKDLVNGLTRALQAGSKTTQVLRAALAFFNLANTDSDVMMEETELILMGSVFEQLFDAENSAYRLGKKFGELFKPYGSVTVETALGVRPGIKLDPENEAAQKQWFVHQKWMEELHQLRSKYIHGESTTKRDWGWIRLEHLIMAAFVFPLSVKLLLSQEGHYTLTDDDIGSCHAIDQLLTKANWWEVVGSQSNATVWQETLFEAKSDFSWEKAIQGFADSIKEEVDD